MPTRRFERIALTQLLVGGCVVFGACVMIEHAQAQPGYVPRPTPLPPPVFNPSRHGASTELQTHNTFDTKHNTFDTKRRSK